MARVRMVTRTVEVTVAEVMQININTAEVKILTYELSGKYADTNSILKQLNKDTPEEIKVVAVQSTDTKEVLYGMSEADFIRIAQILPPRTSTEAEE